MLRVKKVSDAIFPRDFSKTLQSYIHIFRDDFSRIRNVQISNIIKHYENIDIITSGSHTPFPGKVLESEILLNLINSLKEKYDIILVDTPPVLVVSDALICSKFVSQYIVTVTFAKTKKADFEETMRQLKSDNKIKIAGVVFNKKKYKKDSYDYKNKYY